MLPSLEMNPSVLFLGWSLKICKVTYTHLTKDFNSPSELFLFTSVLAYLCEFNTEDQRSFLLLKCVVDFVYG